MLKNFFLNILSQPVWINSFLGDSDSEFSGHQLLGHFVLVITVQNVFTDLLMKPDQIVPAFERGPLWIIVITHFTLTHTNRIG